MMKKVWTTALVTCAFSLLVTDKVVAAPDLDKMQQQMDALQQQNEQMAKRIAELEKTEMPASGADNSKTAQENEGMAARINDHISLNGVIEVEMSLADDFVGESNEDIRLGKAELNLAAEATEWAKGVFGVEWDDEEDKITINETFVVLGGSESFPATVQAGRFIVPFGVFAANTVSDPLTKEAFETKEDAVMFGYEKNGFTARVYAFNGDTNEGGDEESIDHYGAALRYTQEHDGLTLNAGLGYINSILDADGMSDDYGSRAVAAAGMPGFSFDPNHSYLNADYVGGVAVNFSVTVAGFTLFGEYITAIDDYTMDFVEGGISGSYSAKPSACQLEVAYETELSGYGAIFALGYSTSEDMGGFLPESRLALAGTVELTKGISLAAEFTHDTDYAVNDGGTDEDANALTLKLGYKF